MALCCNTLVTTEYISVSKIQSWKIHSRLLLSLLVSHLKLQNNTDASFFDTMDNILDKHAPIKKTIKYKLKLKTASWITPALQKFIYIKNKFFKNCIKKEDLSQKNELHNDYKIYRNRNSILMKISKQYYFTKYFESHSTNIKNIWKGIKSIISMKSSSLIPPTLLLFQNETKLKKNCKYFQQLFQYYRQKDPS